MNADEPTSSSEAERIRKWRQKKQRKNRNRVNVHYEKHKAKILGTRKKKRLAAKALETCSSQDGNIPLPASSFPSRTAKKRALDKARKALPHSPRRRAEVITSLLDSPTTQKFVSSLVALNSTEQQEEVRLAKAIIQDVSSVVDDTKNKRSDGARTTMHLGLSVLCGSHVAQGNMRKSLAQVLNINRRRIAMSVGQETTLLCDKEALWALTKRQTRSDAIPDDHKKLAQDFWCSPGISRTTGNKKDVKRERTGPKQYVVHEKQVLEKTQTEVCVQQSICYVNVKRMETISALLSVRTSDRDKINITKNYS